MELFGKGYLKQGLSINPTVLEWITRYARCLNLPEVAKAQCIDKPVQDPHELEEQVFGLAEETPADMLKRRPNWKTLEKYSRLVETGRVPLSVLAL